MNKTIGFIGCGNMGGSIARAVAKTGVNVLLSDTFSSKAKELAKEIKATATDNSTISKSADVVFLGVKPEQLAVFNSEGRDSLVADVNAGILASADKRADNILGSVRDGENSSSALYLERDASLLKESLGVRGVKSAQSAVKKTGICGDVLQKLLNRAIVGDVASALARNGKLSSATVVSLKESDFSSVARGAVRRHKSCRAAADDGNACVS